MNTSVRRFNHVLWDTLAITEIGVSDSIPTEKLAPSNEAADKNIVYNRISNEFLDYNDHISKYIWGNGISSLWEDNNDRTCYFPWDYNCTSWNAVKLSNFTPIHKIVIKVTQNHIRNLGLMIQASRDYEEWTTLYTINSLDIKKLQRSVLEIFLSDNTEYLYVRILQINSRYGYDITSLQLYARETYPEPLPTSENTLVYVFNGDITVDGLRYNAPCGILKLETASFNVSHKHDDNSRTFWVSFKGKNTVELLEQAFFDFKNPIFSIQSRAYLNELTNFVNEFSYELNADENQIQLISRLLGMLALHSKYNNTRHNAQSIQEKYIIAAMEYINKNKYNSPSLGDIAKNCSISEKYLIKLFKEHIGMTPIQYHNTWKIQSAKRLLDTTQMSIESISKELKFSSPEYFCRMFKKHEGMSPSIYRKKIH